MNSDKDNDKRKYLNLLITIRKEINEYYDNNRKIFFVNLGFVSGKHYYNTEYTKILMTCKQFKKFDDYEYRIILSMIKNTIDYNIFINNNCRKYLLQLLDEYENR